MFFRKSIKEREMKDKILLFLLICTPSMGMTYLGSPVSNLQTGDTSFGFEWATAETDIKFNAFGYLDEIPDIETNIMMGRFALGIANKSEIFARVGLGEIEGMNKDFSWGGGLKVFTSERGDLSSGLIGQITNLRGDETETIGPYLIHGEMDLYQIQFASGINWHIGSADLYGGPLLQMFTGEMDIEGIIIDFDEHPQFGGFGGLSVNISENCLISGEFQATSGGWMAGVNAQIKFGQGTATAHRKDSNLPTLNKTFRTYKPQKVKPDSSTYKMKTDEKGEPLKDEKGIFIFEEIKK